jgi:hypothetical protein
MTDDPWSNSFIEDMREEEGGGMGIEQTREGSSRDGWRDPSKPTQEGEKKSLVAEMTAHQHTRFRKNLTGKGHNRGQALFSKSLHSSLHDTSQASSHH